MIPFIFRCAIGIVAGVVLLVVAYFIISPFVRKWQSIRYSHMLKEYYRKYGTHLLESNSLQEEIYHKVCLFSETWGFKRDLQAVKFDINKLFEDKTPGDSKSNTVTEVAGCWIICPTRTFPIHPANMIGMSTLDSTAYIRTLVICENEVYYVSCSNFVGEELKNKNVLHINIANYQAKNANCTIDWSKCQRYEIADEQNRNTLLGVLCSSLAACYDMWSCALSDSEAKSICDKYTLQLNLLLRSCEIRTKITADGWQFYFNNAPIALEEVIKKLPDEVLSKRLDQSTCTPTKAPTLLRDKSSQFSPNAAQSYPTPPMEQPYILEEEYISQLEDLYRKFGNNAFHYLTSIQNQTGYSKEKIKIDLKKIRDTIDTISPPQYLQSKSIRPTIRTAQQAPVPPPKAPNKPSIEEELLNYLKTQPICWEFPLTTQDKALNKFCEALVFSDSVTGVGSNEAIKNLELTIQKKRARNPRLADHNAAMEGNILAILYEYSYLMHIFHALDDMKFDTTKVDIQKLWLLIQKDCNARINNLAEEKRKNPTIQIVLDKYNYDHQITQLNVLKDATGREMDYIISFIMAYSLLAVISLLLGNPKLLQPLKPYSADDIAGMMNALINVSAGLRFTAYSR